MRKVLTLRKAVLESYRELRPKIQGRSPPKCVIRSVGLATTAHQAAKPQNRKKAYFASPICQSMNA